jgi:hypothetical protein
MGRPSKEYIPDVEDCERCPDIWIGCCTARCKPFLPIRYMQSYGEDFLSKNDRKIIFGSKKRKNKEDAKW